MTTYGAAADSATVVARSGAPGDATATARVASWATPASAAAPAASAAPGRTGLAEECGLVGLRAPTAGPLARYAHLGLYALQHRGQEAAGIAVERPDGRIVVSKRRGLVERAIRPADVERLGATRAAIGHVRYATSGDSASPEDRQPLVVKLHAGPLALAHNGMLVNSLALTDELERQGAIFRTTMDSEVFAHLLARANGRPFDEALALACSRVEGSYSLVALHRGRLFALRDPRGFRPLWVGRKDDTWIVASETCAFDLLEARPEYHLAPGELAVIDDEGCRRQQLLEPRSASPCIFELIYLARPDSLVFDRSVYQFRKTCGSLLAANLPPEALAGLSNPVVVPIPDSGTPAAMGFAQAAGIPFEMGLIRNHYVGRTFIQPFHDVRNLSLKIKLNPVPGFFRDRDVILVDDSLVRGTTCRRIVEIVRDCGARRIHLAIAAPPIRHSCFYGVDTPDERRLLARSMDDEAMAASLGAERIDFLRRTDLQRAFGDGTFCHACLSGQYPLPVTTAEKPRREG